MLNRYNRSGGCVAAFTIHLRAVHPYGSVLSYRNAEVLLPLPYCPAMPCPALQARVAVDYEFEYGGSAESLSAWFFEDRGFLPPDLIVANGYDTIPKTLMARAVRAGATLRLNFTVTAVSRSPFSVIITGEGPTGGTENITADFAIITLPLRVLKRGLVRFTPPLSAVKQGAIASLGFGTVNKVVFFYNMAFWPPRVNEFFIEDASSPPERGKWVDWINLIPLYGQTALMGVAVGAYADGMASMSDDAIVADAMDKMLTMFPKGNTMAGLQLQHVVIRKWNSDPYAYGSYSYAYLGDRGAGSRDIEYDLLARPEGILLFAGEHTIGPLRSSVHGAYLSGMREALRIIS